MRFRFLASLVVALSSSPVFGQAGSLQDLSRAVRPDAAPIVIYTAREFVTLDPSKPTVKAVSVRGDRILATGALDEVKAAAADEPYSVDETFARQVVVPGLIAQHDHPLLAALTMTSEIIAIHYCPVK